MRHPYYEAPGFIRERVLSSDALIRETAAMY
jgi:hypothetical protein